MRRDWVAGWMAGDLQQRTKRETETAGRAATEYLGARRRLKLLLVSHEWERRLGAWRAAEEEQWRRRRRAKGADIFVFCIIKLKERRRV